MSLVTSSPTKTMKLNAADYAANSLVQQSWACELIAKLNLRGEAAVLKHRGRLMVSCGGKGNAQDVFVVLRTEMRLARWRKFFRTMPKPYFFYAPEDYEKWLPRFGFKIQRRKLAPKDAAYN